MSDINSSLIGFLKKKSLFSASPDRSARRKNKSKDKKLFAGSPTTPRNQGFKQQRSLRNFNTQSSNNFHNEKSNRNLVNMEAQSDLGAQSVVQETPIRYYDTKQDNKNQTKVVRRNFNFKNPEEPKNTIRVEERPNLPKNTTANNNNNQEITNIWASLVSHSMSFQSARMESKQCLQSLSTNLQTEISNLNYKLDVFHSKMATLLNNQFKNLHAEINQIVDKVFKQSQANIRAYIKEQQEILGSELLEMRQKLRTEYEKVETMKDDINKPNWKKVAGQLLSDDLQEKVEQMMAKSKRMDIGVWQIGDLGANKVKALQFQLRQMVTLST